MSAATVVVTTRPARPVRPQASLRWRDLAPAALVVALAVIGPALAPDDGCASTDGPQFRCWLERQA